MKNRKNTYHFAIALCLITFLISCKRDFLDKKPASNLNVPTTLGDLQLLLDNTQDFRSPSLGELSSDDIYIATTEWNNQTRPYFANTYIWAKDIFAGQGGVNDWNQPYSEILASNVSLEQLEYIKRDDGNKDIYDNVKGMALFTRAYAFFDLAQVYALPYDENTAESDLGIPIRTVADINVPITRATLQDTYKQILADALKAKSLITINYTKNFFNRPTKASACGFLSRIYLAMRNYEKAGNYADSALRFHSKLIDYNEVSTISRAPFPVINDEILYKKSLAGNDPMIYVYSAQGYSIDTLLYKSYKDGDLRKLVYFTVNGKTINKKGGYSGGVGAQNSIATDEMYLTRAECYAREGKLAEAMADLNTLMKMRWSNAAHFPTFTATNASDALNQILLERRKELIMRGLRWNDIRRLNKDGFNITLTRKLNGIIYRLPPNDPRYALPIPPDVIQLSGIQQNIR